MDPFNHRDIDSNCQIDYSLFLFYIEKQSTKEVAKNARIPSMSYFVALLDSLKIYLSHHAPIKFEDFIKKNFIIQDDDDYE